MSETWINFFNSGIGSVIKAVLILILAFIVAAVVKNIVIKLLSKTKWGSKKDTADSNGEYINKTVILIGKLVELIIFLLFVPGIFEALGMTQVSAPILALLNTVWSYVPNVLAAGIILWVGFYVARLVRELLVPVLNKLEVNKLQKIAGIEVSEQGKLSNTLAYIVYVLILIPIIIAALQVLNIKAISDPATAMLAIIFNYIPSILAALIIIAIGWILARFIGDIVARLIAASGLDAKIAKLTGTEGKTTFSAIVGKTVEIILIIFFVVESVSTLHLGVLTKIGTAVIAYMPAVLASVLIFGICFFLASVASAALKRNGHGSAAVFAKAAIYIVGAFMILNQLGIASVIVNSTFILIVAAVAVAFAISFGIGGRDFAKNMLARLESVIDFPKKNS